MKKIDKLLLRSFLGPFVLTFFIALFVLLMQFLWKWVDELVGKGLDGVIISKLLFYTSATLVPLALPLAILLASIMTFGNLAEHFELTALKSSGISLQRIMRPLIIAALFISMAAFYFSNYVLPIANLKMQTLLHDVRNQKFTLLIKEGIYYNGIDGYVIKIDKKDPDGKTIYNVTIYDHSDNSGNIKMVMAKKGLMQMSDDERYLIVTLFNGSSYEETRKTTGRNDTRPMTRTEFTEEKIRFDLGQFKMSRTNEDIYKDNFQMLSIRQLGIAIDSLESRINELGSSKYNSINSFIGIPKKSFRPQINDSIHYATLNLKKQNYILNFDKDHRINIISSALASARNARQMLENNSLDIEGRKKILYRHEIEFNRKFTLSIACLILFLIGAPLGAIIRKGGLGMPLVVSVLFFVVYHIVSISGEKMAREGYWTAERGMWLSSMVLLPIGIFLAYKASTDSALFDRDAYRKFFRKIFFLKSA